MRERGCTLIALLPLLAHTEWYARYVDAAHEVHLVSGALVFPNPFLDIDTPKRSFLWERSYALVVWRPGAPPAAPRYARLEPDALPADDGSAQLRLRTCRRCGRVRVLPRHTSAAAARLTAAWECRLSPDSKYNRCEAPEWVPMCVK